MTDRLYPQAQRQQIIYLLKYSSQKKLKFNLRFTGVSFFLFGVCVSSYKTPEVVSTEGTPPDKRHPEDSYPLLDNFESISEGLKESTWDNLKSENCWCSQVLHGSRLAWKKERLL